MMFFKERKMVRRYRDEDFDQVRQWLIDRNMKVFHPAILPKTGFIVDEVAVVFLYRTDSDIAYMENLISNPKSRDTDRDDAINQLVEVTFLAATQLGFKFVMAMTKNPKVIERAILAGAKCDGGNVHLTKQLK